MTYAAALRYLDGLIRADQPRLPYHAEKLERMRHLLGLLGRPQVRMPIVLVAGTKGKGSTAVMIAEMLGAAGWRVGLTVKPHLVDYRERIRVGGRMISRAALATLVTAVRPAVEAGRDLPGGRPTYVETTVAMALLHFARQQVDIAVVEVGIGGRLDATNVVDPRVSVITPISYDHTELLGSTLREIAREKAGIIRPGGRVVAAPQPDEAGAVIEQACADAGARLVLVGRDIEVVPHASTLDGVQATIRGIRDRYEVHVPLLGRHQAVNAATAVGAIELLADDGLLVGQDALRRGLSALRWPARVELVDTRPYILVDVGHNPASMAALCATLQELLGGRRVVLAFGILATKDYRSVTALVAPLADMVITTTPDNPHALPAPDLADEVRRYTPHVIAVPDRHAAIERARALTGPDDVLVVTGSFYLVGMAREWLVHRKPAVAARN